MKDEQPWKPELPKLDVPKSSDHHEYGKTFDTNESQQQVPPGIVRFKTKEGTLYFQYPHSDYDNWVRFHLTEGSTIHTISVDGKEWSVEEDVDCNMGGGIIKELRYIEGNWVAFMEVHHNGTTQLNRVSNIRKKSKPTPSSLDRSGSQPGKEESKSEQLKNMLEDVINELDLSDGMIEKHGPIGTPPAELVRLVLARKDLEFKMLKTGFKHIDPQPSQSGEGEGDLTAAYTRQIYKLKCEIDSLNRELTALKSRPSEGWSDETLLKDFTYWLGEKQYPITALIHFKEFLSSYKQKSQTEIK